MIGTGAARQVTLRSQLDTLAAAVHLPAPVSMEQLGQAYGYIHYRTDLPSVDVRTASRHTLRFDGLADRAHVFLGGALVGVVSRQDEHPSLAIEIPGAGAALEVLVENTGRVNYGPYMHDRKGVRGVWLDYQQLFGWQARSLPLADITLIERALEQHALPSSTASDPVPAPDPIVEPTFFGFDVDVDAAAGAAGDAFVALPGWSRGRLWLNGFNLGAYRAEGPQATLYAPGPLWNAGTNHLVVLELDRAGDQLEVRDQPDLGPLADRRDEEG